MEVYSHPDYLERIRRGAYARWDPQGKAQMAVTQDKEMPNTYLFHIGGGRDGSSISRAS